MRTLRPVLTTILFLAFFLPTMITRADPTIGGCQVFPIGANVNPWNADISGAAIDTTWDNYIHGAGSGLDSRNVHPDFDQNPGDGIPYITVDSTQPKVPVTFGDEARDESDPGPYPIPPNAPIEGGPGATGDRHVLVIETDNCILYELDEGRYVGGSQHAWTAYSGAIFNLNSNALRPDDWTSADAAGLPIFPGLARCDEANTGTINHAFRFTLRHTGYSHIYPATHDAGGGSSYPPMGLRVRLRADYPETNLTTQALAVIKALKKYGMILADNGSDWFITGTSGSCWGDQVLSDLENIAGSDFEAIQSPSAATVVLPPVSLYSPANGAQVNGASVLDWNTITSADQYKVYVDQNPNPTTLVTTRNANQTTEFTPSGSLITGFTYFWRVEAIDTDTNPDTVVSSPPRSFVMASPPGVGPTENYYTIAHPTFTWNRVIGASSYNIQISSNSTFSGTPIEQHSVTVATTLSYTMTTALTDGVYYWRVQACTAPTSCGAWVSQTFIVNV